MKKLPKPGSSTSFFFKKNIVVTVGNYGAVVALHEKGDIKNRIFLNDLNDEAKIELKTFFTANKATPVRVMLDTLDQSYKKKVYNSPSINKLIVKRDMANDGDRDSIKNYMILGRVKPGSSIFGQKNDAMRYRWECLFVSSSNSETINGWIDFLLSMPNRLVGIYMLPVEAFSLYKILKNQIKSKSKALNNHQDLCCFIIQTKVIGVRQVVFSGRSVVFTRIVDYDFAGSEFLDKYQQDLTSTFEYLKRLFPDMSPSDIDVVNILPSDALKTLEQISNQQEFSIINYTPFEAASEAGYPKLLPKNANFCDLIISRVFSKGKKILRFGTPKMKLLERFFLILRSTYYCNVLLLFTICVMWLVIAAEEFTRSESIDAETTKKKIIVDDLTRFKKSILTDSQVTSDGEAVEVERIMDIGKMYEALSVIDAGLSATEFYSKMKFFKSLGVKLKEFSYSMSEFNTSSPQANPNFSFNVSGQLINKSGNIEDLFQDFDVLSGEMKRAFEGYDVKYSELSRNIDFSQKYYNSPIDFKVSRGVKSQ